MDPLAGYDIKTVPYKTVQDIEILADILLPKGLVSGKHPIVVNWHGGGLVTGSRNFTPFFPGWLHAFAAENSAIVISADYRLLPEARGVDILEDLESFWGWLKSNFPQILREVTHGSHEADLDHVLLNGGSAGGWCAMHLALSHVDDVRAVMVQYPSLITDDELDASQNDTRTLMGHPVWTRQKVEEEVAKTAPGAVVVAGEWERLLFCFSAKAWGLLRLWVGLEDRCVPFRRITAGARLPPKVWVIHGTADSVVPVEHTRRFIAKAQKCELSTEFKADYYEGKEHGFDEVLTADEIRDGLEWVRGAWLTLDPKYGVPSKIQS